MRYAAFKATEYQCTVDGLPPDCKHILQISQSTFLQPMHEAFWDPRAWTCNIAAPDACSFTVVAFLHLACKPSSATWRVLLNFGQIEYHHGLQSDSEAKQIQSTHA